MCSLFLPCGRLFFPLERVGSFSRSVVINCEVFNETRRLNKGIIFRCHPAMSYNTDTSIVVADVRDAFESPSKRLSDVFSDSLSAKDGGESYAPAPKIRKEENAEAASKLRSHRKNYFALLSYCGKNYFGSARNRKGPLLKPDFRTIEDTFLEALLQTGHISEENFQKPSTASFYSASRTDKGVSAKRAVFSLWTGAGPDSLEVINAALPPEIRLMELIKVTKSMHPKWRSTGRTYSYTMPSYAFCPLEENITPNWKITTEIVEQIRGILPYFVGTHNYHNFTSGRAPTDRSCIRIVVDFQCEDPFEKGGTEWIRLRIRGQSFMLHQIRKIVGLVIAVVRGYTPKETIPYSFEETRIDLPKAPGLGLLLEDIHYDWYNNQFGNDGIHKPLNWIESSQKVEKFYENFIFPELIKGETGDGGNMLSWLPTLMYNTFGPRDHEEETRSPYGTLAGKLAALKNSDNEKEEKFSVEEKGSVG